MSVKWATEKKNVSINGERTRRRFHSAVNAEARTASSIPVSCCQLQHTRGRRHERTCTDARTHTRTHSCMCVQLLKRERPDVDLLCHLACRWRLPMPQARGALVQAWSGLIRRYCSLAGSYWKNNRNVGSALPAFASRHGPTFYGNFRGDLAPKTGPHPQGQSAAPSGREASRRK